MKRDMDAIRKIVLAAKDADKQITNLEGVDQQTFMNSVALLHEAGLVHAAIRESHGTAQAALLFRLTWNGHEFADAIKDESLWNKAREVVLKPAAGWTFSILTEYLKAQILGRLPGM
jgi:hypothetical protein